MRFGWMLRRNAGIITRSPLHRWAGALAIASMLALVGFAVGAQDAGKDLPSAETIIEKGIEATGGRAAIENVRTMVTKSTMELPAMGIKASMTHYAALPHSSYSVIESPEMGKIEEGASGGVYWEMTQMTGPRIKEGEEKALAKRSALDSDLHWRETFPDVSVAGIDTVDGRPCYKVVMIPTEGPVDTRYYDMETYLVVKQEMEVESPMGRIPMESFANDYRWVEGMLIPHRSRQVVMKMQEMVFTTDSIACNVAIPDSVFRLPEPIQALLAKSAAPAESAPAGETEKAGSSTASPGK